VLGTLSGGSRGVVLIARESLWKDKRGVSFMCKCTELEGWISGVVGARYFQWRPKRGGVIDTGTLSGASRGVGWLVLGTLSGDPRGVVLLIPGLSVEPQKKWCY
jgi:hypothetical protein